MSDLEFRNAWLLLLAIPLLPLAYLVFQRSTSNVKISSLELVGDVTKSVRQRLTLLPSILLSLGTLALIFAIAGPRTPDDQTRIRRDGVAIMLIVDRSSSMNARDLVEDDQSVDRLAVVKNVLQRFILGDKEIGEGRPDDMIGLVTFAGFADSICPLTFDHRNLAMLINEVEIVETRSEDGTAIGDGLALAIERLRLSKAKSRIAVFLTDGVNNTGVIEPLEAADLAEKTGVKVYTIGTGTRGMAPVPSVDPFSNRIVLRPAPVDIDEATLQQIAEKTGGQYFRATDANNLDEIYHEIDQLEKTEVSRIRFLRYTEHYRSATFIAMGLIVASMVLDRTVFRRLP